MYGRTTRKTEIVFPKDKTKGYYCFRIVVNWDRDWKVPIRLQVYDWDNMLVEDYGYEHLRFDAGLTDADFDSKNREYRF